MPQAGRAVWGVSHRGRCQDAAVTRDRYADRLDPSRYANDDDTVGIFESSPDAPDALWLSGRLFGRLTGVAAAYELHTLPLLRGLDTDRLNRARCESLLDELAFVADRLNDPPAVQTAQAIFDYVGSRLRRPGWNGAITFEGD
jgi:hypothetical protein